MSVQMTIRMIVHENNLNPSFPILSSEMNFVELVQIQFWTNLAFQHLGSIFQILFGLQIPTFLTPGI